MGEVGYCQRRGTVGTSCADGCDEGLVCVNEVCRTPDNQCGCDEPLLCVGSGCVEPGARGAPCATDADCTEGPCYENEDGALVCGRDQCAVNEDCPSLVCQPGAEGRRCLDEGRYEGEQCAFTYLDDGEIEQVQDSPCVDGLRCWVATPYNLTCGPIQGEGEACNNNVSSPGSTGCADDLHCSALHLCAPGVINNDGDASYGFCLEDLECSGGVCLQPDGRCSFATCNVDEDCAEGLVCGWLPGGGGCVVPAVLGETCLNDFTDGRLFEGGSFYRPCADDLACIISVQDAPYMVCSPSRQEGEACVGSPRSINYGTPYEIRADSGCADGLTCSAGVCVP